jgi:hypothetical protein
VIDLLGAGPVWEPVRPPGANGDAERAKLGAGLALMRFPPGWERDARGFYDAGEELVVLSGRIYVSSISYRTGHYGWIPPGGFRHDTVSPDGATVLSWYAHRPQWTDAARGAPLGPSLRAPLDTLVLPPQGILLRGGGAGHEHGRTEMLPAQPSTVEDGTELLWIADAHWHRVGPGPTPVRAGPVLARWG